jgi:hypothetical protein
MYEYFTYEKWTKASLQSHDHATIRISCDAIDILSRESKRSVGRIWEKIASVSGSTVYFETNDEAVRLIATQMGRSGWQVTGIRLDPDEFGAIVVQQSDGRTTNPESIRGRIRNRNPGSPTDKRRATQTMYGVIGQTDTDAMRQAILARQATRK